MSHELASTTRKGTHVLLIVGSMSLQSRTRQLAMVLQDTLQSLGAGTTLWDLMALPLGVTGSGGDEASRFVQAVREADAVVLATPLYHGSYSGLLKCALDQLPRGAFVGRPIGLMSHGASSAFPAAACRDLEAVVRSLKGIAATTTVSTDDSAYEGARLTSTKAIARVQKLSRELLELTRLLAPLSRELSA